MAARFQSAHRRDGDAPADGNVAIQAQPRALAALGKAARFEREHRHDRERVVNFEQVNVLRPQAGLLVGLGALSAAPSNPSKSRRSCSAMLSVAMAEARMCTGCSLNWRAISVGHSTTAAEPSHTGELSSRFTGSAIILAFLKSSALTGNGNMAYGLFTAFLMRVDGKRRKLFVLDAVLVHVAAHQQRIERDERQAVLRLKVAVGGHRQCWPSPDRRAGRSSFPRPPRRQNRTARPPRRHSRSAAPPRPSRTPLQS